MKWLFKSSPAQTEPTTELPSQDEWSRICSHIAPEFEEAREQFFSKCIGYLARLETVSGIPILNRNLTGEGELALMGYQLLGVGYFYSIPKPERDDFRNVLLKCVCRSRYPAVSYYQESLMRRAAGHHGTPEARVEFVYGDVELLVVDDLLDYIAGRPISEENNRNVADTRRQVAHKLPIVSARAKLSIAKAIGDRQETQHLMDGMKGIMDFPNGPEWTSHDTTRPEAT